MRAVYAASTTGALPAGVGSMRSPGFSGGLAALGLSLSNPEGTGKVLL